MSIEPQPRSHSMEVSQPDAQETPCFSNYALPLHAPVQHFQIELNLGIR